jgi:hypothetical protein
MLDAYIVEGIRPTVGDKATSQALVITEWARFG